MSSRHYFSWEEEEANKLGHIDERSYRSDFTHDRYAYDGEDRAYWDGREDEAKERKRREEEQEEEEAREREEDERRERQRRMQAEFEREQELLYERQQQEAFDDYIRDSDEEEYNRVMSEIAETPCTEQELFMQIEEDERRYQETKPDSN